MKLDQCRPDLRKRIEEQIAYENRISSKKPEPYTKLQEQQADHQAQERRHNAGDRSKDKTVDEPVHGKFRVTIVLRYSDRIGRDPDGNASTLLDCLIAATRRFAALDQ